MCKGNLGTSREFGVGHHQVLLLPKQNVTTYETRPEKMTWSNKTASPRTLLETLILKVYRLVGSIEHSTLFRYPDADERWFKNWRFWCLNGTFNWFKYVCASLLFTGMGLVWYARVLPERWPEAKGYEYEWVALPLSHGYGFSFDRTTRWLGPYNDDSDYGSTAWIEPLHTVIMAGCFWAFGKSGRLLLVLLNFVWLGITCIVVYQIVRRIVGSEAGLITSILLALFPANRFLLSYIGNSALTSLLICCCALALIYCIEYTSVRRGLTLGLVLGFTCLTHASALLLVPFSAVMILITSGMRSLRPCISAAAVLIVAALVISPWTFRNWITFGEFVPVRSGLGFALHYVTPALAHTFTPGLRPDHQWKDPPWTAKNAAEAVSILNNLQSQAKIMQYSKDTVVALRPVGYDQFNEAQRDAVFLSHTVDFALAHPLIVLKMMVAKGIAFFFTNWPSVGFLTAIALIGALIKITDQRANVITMFILLFAFPYMLSAPVYYRYRYPIESLIFVLLGLLLGVLINVGREWRREIQQPAH
jgi:hypothetical protein